VEGIEPQPLPWEEPGWSERVGSWVGAEIARLGLEPHGDLELVRARPWAAVARIATADGDVWFKEPAPSLAFEPALTVAVARRCRDFAPEVVSTSGTWLLTRDAGPQLRAALASGDAAPPWDDLLARYAELQIRLIDDADDLVRLGAPDKRPAVVADAYPSIVGRGAGLGTVDVERLHALAPRVAAAAEVLEGAVPATAIHEEVHEANIFVRDGRPRLLDWGEGAVSHPFAGIVNTFRDIAFRRKLEPDAPELLRLRSAYLEPWTRFASPRELVELFDQGYVLGTLCRALTWTRVLAGQSDSVRGEYGRNAAVWLDVIFREAVEEGVRLGA
jgi:hypothetical protein